MRIIRLLLIFFLMPLMVSGATITGSLVDLTGSAIDMDITFKSLNPTGASGPSIVVPSSKKIRTQNGQFTISLLSGQYQVISDRYNVYAEVPSGDGTYPLQDLVPGMITFGDISGIVAVAGITNLTGEVLATGPGSAASVIATNAVTNVKIAAGVDAVKISSGDVTNTEFDFLNGVTSAIQTQIDAKQATGNYVTSLTGDVTAAGPGASVATIANNSVTNPKVSTGIDAAKLGGGNVSNTEFDYLNGVTSAIQTQLNAKQASGNYVTALTGEVTAAGPGSVAATITAGVDAAKISGGGVSNTEFDYLNGVTSAIQTQLNSKQATGNYVTALTGDVVATGPGSVSATIQDGSVTGAKIFDATIGSEDIATGISIDDLSATGTLGVEILSPQFSQRNAYRAGSFTNDATFILPVTYSQFAITNAGNLNITVQTNTPESIIVISGVSTSDIDPATITISNAAPREERADNALVSTMTIGAATRGYWTLILVIDGGVIERWSAAGDTFSPQIYANIVSFSPSGNLASTNVQTALVELDNEKASAFSLATVANTGQYTDLLGEPPTSALLSVYASGTPYQLTTTPALLNFGTTDPSLPITVTGYYRVVGRVNLKYNAATFASPSVITLSIRNPNGNEVANSSTALTTITSTTNLSTFAVVMLPVVGYNAGSTTNSLQLWGSIDVAPSAGSVDAVEASIHVERIETFSVVDASAPTLTSATISTNGQQLTLVLNEAVNIGSGGNGGFVITPSGGASSLTYSSGSGSTTLIYNLGRTIATNETATLDYTQPGNGVEDASGNDLASFSGTAVTNNSWDTGFTPFTIGTDGSDYMTLSSAPVGIADGPDFTVSMWIDFTDAAGDGVQQDIVWFQSSNFIIRRSTTNTFHIRGETSGGTVLLEAATSVTKVAADGWFHLYITVDLSNASNRHIYFDGVEDASVTWATYTNGSIDLNTVLNRIGAGSSGVNSMRASMCEFYMSGRYLDNPTAFGAGGTPVSIGANGQHPDGLSPGYYFSLVGGGSSWVNDSSGNGNNFTLSGAFSSPSPP